MYDVMQLSVPCLMNLIRSGYVRFVHGGMPLEMFVMSHASAVHIHAVKWGECDFL